MAIVLVYPGTLGQPVALQDVLREAHNEMRTTRQALIDKRTKMRIPLDDDTNWSALDDSVRAVSAAVAAQDGPAAQRAAQAIVDAVAGNTLEPLPEYQPDPALDGIVVTMKIAGDADRRRWVAEVAKAWQAVDESRQRGDAVEVAQALSALDAVCSDVVAAVVVKIEGIEGLADTVAASMPGLVGAGLLSPLYAAARHFLELPPGKAVRCGLPPLST